MKSHSCLDWVCRVRGIVGGLGVDQKDKVGVTVGSSVYGTMVVLTPVTVFCVTTVKPPSQLCFCFNHVRERFFIVEFFLWIGF